MVTGEPFSTDDERALSSTSAERTRGSEPYRPAEQEQAGKGKRAVSQAAGQARQATGQATEQAKQTAGQVKETVQQQASTQITTRKDQAASGLESVAMAVRQVGQQLRQSDQQGFAQYAERAADQVTRVSSYLRDRSTSDLVSDVEQMARRQPAIFLAGAFALGVLGARFLKSSSSRATGASGPGGSGPGRTYGRPAPGHTTGPSDYGIYDPGTTGMETREFRV